jgi:hypothetical protein
MDSGECCHADLASSTSRYRNRLGALLTCVWSSLAISAWERTFTTQQIETLRDVHTLPLPDMAPPPLGPDIGAATPRHRLTVCSLPPRPPIARRVGGPDNRRVNGRRPPACGGPASSPTALGLVLAAASICTGPGQVVLCTSSGQVRPGGVGVPQGSSQVLLLC